MSRREVSTRDDVTKGWGDVIRIKDIDKPYIMKLFDGPRQVNTVFYDSIDEDGKQIKRAVIVPNWWDSPFAEITKAERKVRARMIEERLGNTEEAKKQIKSVRSYYDPDTRYHALGFLKSDSVPTVNHIELKWGAYDDIIRAESERYVDQNGEVNSSKLMYGLIPFLWFNVRKVRKKEGSNVKDEWNVEYKAKVVDELCITKGKIGAQWLPPKTKVFIDTDKKEFILENPTGEAVIPVIEKGLYTKAEWAALCSYETTLDDMIKPLDPETQREKFEKYPWKIDAVGEDGKPLNPYWELTLKEIAEKAKALPIIKSEHRLPPKETMVDDTSYLPDKEESSKTEPAEETEFEVVEPDKKSDDLIEPEENTEEQENEWSV